MKKIVIMSPHLRLSGGTRVLTSLAQGLGNRGFEVVLCCNRIGSTLSWLPKELSYEIKNIGTDHMYGIPNCDVIIDYGDNNPYFVKQGPKHILYLQGFGTQDKQEYVNLHYKYDGVISTSKWLHALSRRFGHTKTFIIAPGISEIFKPQPIQKNKHKIIGCLYHESPSKNLGMFIASMNVVAKTKHKITGLLLSSKPIKPGPPVGDAVFNTSIVQNPPQELLPFVYSSTNVWVSVSTNEGFGLPILEAMACGVPTVVVRSYGLDQYLKNKTNCMLVNNNKKEVSDAISVVLGDVTLQQTLIKNGKELASKFTWNNTINGFVNVFNSL